MTAQWQWFIHMNYFRLAGDILHVLSIFLLIRKIIIGKTCVGISLRTIYLYAIVFSTRYIDVFWNTLSIYLTVMKLLFLGSTFFTIYLIRTKPYLRATYDKSHDNFRIHFLVLPAVAMAVILNLGHIMEYNFSHIVWSFSIILESVAIMPQLFLLQRTGEVDSLGSDYIFTLGGYRAFYILNWVYRILSEPHYTQHTGTWLVWFFGLVQTLLYIDFFYYYVTSKWYGKKMALPT